MKKNDRLVGIKDDIVLQDKLWWAYVMADDLLLKCRVTPDAVPEVAAVVAGMLAEFLYHLPEQFYWVEGES